jgi:outer membrane immunogenic protein
MKIKLALTALLASTAMASAADLAARPYTKAPVAAPVYSWTGFYVGGNAGYAWGDARFDNGLGCADTGVNYICSTANPDTLANAAAVSALGGSRSSGNFTGGVHAGYNWQSGAWVLGGEGDFSYFRIRAERVGAGVYPATGAGGASLDGDNFAVGTSVSTDWLATVRGRLGYAFAPNVMLYGTGGLAMSRVSVANAFADDHNHGDPLGGNGGAERSKVKFGWTVGGGLEWAVAPNWTVRTEYLYVDLGSTDVNATITNPVHEGEMTPFRTSVDLTAHIVRAGLSYKFGGPVAARY